MGVLARTLAAFVPVSMECGRPAAPPRPPYSQPLKINTRVRQVVGSQIAEAFPRGTARHLLHDTKPSTLRNFCSFRMSSRACICDVSSKGRIYDVTRYLLNQVEREPPPSDYSDPE